MLEALIDISAPGPSTSTLSPPDSISTDPNSPTAGELSAMVDETAHVDVRGTDGETEDEMDEDAVVLKRPKID